MLTKFKESVKNNESDVILIIGVILIALISFGAGWLLVPQDKNSIIIQNSSASIQQTISESATSQTESKQTEQGSFVGSINSNKYHWPDCLWAKKIAPENQIWFSSEEEAQNAGYIRCGNFEKYIPISYSEK